MSYLLVTGASSGIGLELALIAARENYNLVLVARNKTNLVKAKQKILTLLGAESVDIQLLAVNLSDPTGPKKVYAFCKKNSIQVTCLINNAGFGDYGDFTRSNLAKQLSMIDLNIRALTELTHLFLPAMIDRREGKIMNLGSVASFLPGPLMSVYFASKNYVLRFSEALSEELRGTGVTVTCLCPGSTKTNFANSAEVTKTHSTATTKVSAKNVAEFGWKHLHEGTLVAIYGFGNKSLLLLAKLLPRRYLLKLVKKIQN